MADPLAVSSWNRIEVTSAQWMLAAAGIEESGPYAAMKAQGLALIFANVLGTFLEDTDPDMTKTMRELNVQLRRAERLVETGDIVHKAVSPVLSAIGNFIGERRDRGRDEDDAASAI
jgi:hypothetical protein